MSKRIIDIPEETYEYWKEHKHEYVLAEAIANSTPLNEVEAEDCISRKQALEAMATYDKFGSDAQDGLIPLRTPALGDRYIPYVHYEDMVSCITHLPSIYPKSEKPCGKWIDVYKGSLIDEYRCSNCNSNPPTKKVGITWGWDFTNYCPNCGAKMVEEQGENT